MAAPVTAYAREMQGHEAQGPRTTYGTLSLGHTKTKTLTERAKEAAASALAAVRRPIGYKSVKEQ